MVEVGLANIPAELIAKIGSLGNWIQAIGLVIILGVIFQIVNIIINIKRKNALNEFKKDIARVEKKIDKIEKKLD